MPRPNLGNCVTEKKICSGNITKELCVEITVQTTRKIRFKTKRCPCQNREAGIRPSNNPTPEDEEEEEGGMDGGHPQRLKF